MPIVDKLEVKISYGDALRVASEAWVKVFGRLPDHDELTIVVAWSAHETARFKNAFNYNMGGLTASRNYKGNYYSSPTHEYERQPDGTKKKVPRRRLFRAYPTLLAGFVALLSMLGEGYPQAVEGLRRGDVAAFVAGLLEGWGKSLDWFTAPPHLYLAAVAAHVPEVERHLDGMGAKGEALYEQGTWGGDLFDRIMTAAEAERGLSSRRFRRGRGLSIGLRRRARPDVAVLRHRRAGRRRRADALDRRLVVAPAPDLLPRSSRRERLGAAMIKTPCPVRGDRGERCGKEADHGDVHLSRSGSVWSSGYVAVTFQDDTWRRLGEGLGRTAVEMGEIVASAGDDLSLAPLIVERVEAQRRALEAAGEEVEAFDLACQEQRARAEAAERDLAAARADLQKAGSLASAPLRVALLDALKIADEGYKAGAFQKACDGVRTRLLDALGSLPKPPGACCDGGDLDDDAVEAMTQSPIAETRALAAEVKRRREAARLRNDRTGPILAAVKEALGHLTRPEGSTVADAVLDAVGTLDGLVKTLEGP